MRLYMRPKQSVLDKGSAELMPHRQDDLQTVHALAFVAFSHCAGWKEDGDDLVIVALGS